MISLMLYFQLGFIWYTVDANRYKDEITYFSGVLFWPLTWALTAFTHRHD